MIPYRPRAMYVPADCYRFHVMQSKVLASDTELSCL